MTQLPKMSDLFNKEQFIPINALTWKQPFATMMLHGKKETRSWSTKHRGLILICSGLSHYSDVDLLEICTEEQMDEMAETYLNDESSVIFGHGIAVGLLSNCRPMLPVDQKDCYVKYQEGLWVHEYAFVKRIEPIPFVGGMKWVTITDQNFLSTIRFI